MPLVKEKYTILMIDDDEEDFIIVKDYLNDLPIKYEIEWVADFKKGIDAIKKDCHDMYLVDHQLGPENGIELIKKACEDGCKKPIVLLTGMGNRDVDIQALKVGASDYFAKSKLSVDNLERLLRHSIQRYEYNLHYEKQLTIFKNYFNQSFAPLFIVDENFELIQANDAFLKQFCDPSSQPCIKKIFKQENDYLSLKQKAVTEKSIENYSTALIDILGKEKSVLISLSAVYNEDNQLHGYQGIINDITQLQKAEKELALAEQVNMTGRMARIMAHEVRNPLTNISLAADQLMDELAEQNPESEEIEYAQIIKRNSERINKLISDLLNTTRETKINFQSHCIEELIEQSVNLIKDRAILKNITLKMQLNKDNPTLLNVDSEKITMAFLNIFTNAIEAMDMLENGQLCVECFSNQNFFSVKISDTGKGMDEETKKNLFEPFFTKRSGGMGLGMTAVNNILAIHDAQIFVESQLNKGTSFIIQFNKQTP